MIRHKSITGQSAKKSATEQADDFEDDDDDDDEEDEDDENDDMDIDENNWTFDKLIAMVFVPLIDVTETKWPKWRF